MNKSTFDKELINDIGGFTHNPLGFVYYAYPWGEGDLVGEGRDKPRKWQEGILNDIGSHLRDPATRYEPLLTSVSSGHGIGKSALISWIADWGMSTCDDCKVVITANTENQLRTKTWPEVTKWFNMSINNHWFRPSATSIVSTEQGHDKLWRADAVPWSENNTEAFAGLHNQGKRIILIFDEASNIADKVWEVAEGALTDLETEIIWVAFGNPTRNTGRFRECFRRYRHRWQNQQIDSRTVEGTNKAQIQKWVDDYGEDSDFVKIRVRGLFPNASASQFISELDVDTAMRVELRKDEYDFAPVIITCDPAWTGNDDLVIAKRQGLKADILKVIPKNDNDIEIGNMLARYEDDFDADAVFIDAGYGTGIHSFGKTNGRKWQLVWFGGKADDPGYYNKRSEIWGEMKKWLKEGGSIPNDQYLRDELTSIETVPRSDGKVQLESKESMKDRGLPSPNRGDAIALSFAYPVRSRKAGRSLQSKMSGRKNRARFFKHSWMG